MIKETLFDGSPLCCEWIPIGSDYMLTVWGGTSPHLGSVVMAIARPSLSGEGVSATSSVLNALGHKDEAVARRFAEAVAKEKDCTAVCSCGIHIDALTAAQLRTVEESCELLLSRVLKAIE